jgi:transcriptional regulator with XRE-family HTH domain
MASRSVDPRFTQRMRETRQLRGLSLRELQRLVFFGKSYLHDLETGAKMPTVEAAKRVDEALAAGGELAEMVTQAALKPDEHARLWETSELLLRIQASDTSHTTVEALQVTAFELCCDYGWRDAGELRGEALRWLREVVRLRRAAGLREHGDLLTVAGWLGLLVGCVEYDMGMRTVANASRAAALSLGEEAGNTEIAAWAWEMTAWFALTQGRFSEAIAAAQAGQGLVGESHTVSVQLIGQEAKALARTGDVRAVREALDRGRHLLEKFPRPDRPDHHFVVDPDKWDFYAMDTYRLAGDDERAEHHAHQVLRLGTAADGTEKAPMRMAEARLTLGVASARAGELEQAVGMGMEAFRATRRSLPSLLMVAGELDVELSRRYPKEPSTGDFRAKLRSVS